LDRKYAAAYYNRGLVQSAKKIFDWALGDYNSALRLDPNNAAAYYHRGLAYLRLGYHAKAQADFDKAKQLGYTGPQ